MRRRVRLRLAAKEHRTGAKGDAARPASLAAAPCPLKSPLPRMPLCVAAKGLLVCWDAQAGMAEALTALRAALAHGDRLAGLRSPRPPRADSNQAQVLALLGRTGGAAIAKVMELKAWAPHTVRGYPAGLKRRGIDAGVPAGRTAALTSSAMRPNEFLDSHEDQESPWRSSKAFYSAKILRNPMRVSGSQGSGDDKAMASASHSAALRSRGRWPRAAEFGFPNRESAANVKLSGFPRGLLRLTWAQRHAQ